MTKLFVLSIFNQFTVAAFSPYLQIILRNKGYEYSVVGILTALCQAASIVIPMMVSSLADKTGKTRPFVIGSALLSILFCFPFLQSTSLWVVVVSSFLMNGFFWCLNPLTDGYINGKIHGDTSKYGLIRALGTMSYVVTLLAFAFTGFPKESDNSSIMVSIMVALSLLVVVTFFMPEKEAVKKEKGKKREFFNKNWFPKRFYVFLLAAAFTRIGQVIPDRFISSYMTENLGLGNYFSVFFALGAFIEFFCMIYGGKILRSGKTDSWTLLQISAVGMVVRFMLYLVPGIVPFALAQCCHGLTFGVFHVAVTDYIASNVESEHYEMAMTMYWAVATNFPQMLGAILGGYVVQYCGYPVLFSSYAIFPIIAILILFAQKKLITGKA